MKDTKGKILKSNRKKKTKREEQQEKEELEIWDLLC